jgi:hypothetical protein
MSKIAKFGCEMLSNVENMALQSLQILYTLVLRAEIATIFGPNVGRNFTNFTNFSMFFPGIYFFCQDK